MQFLVCPAQTDRGICFMNSPRGRKKGENGCKNAGNTAHFQKNRMTLYLKKCHQGIPEVSERKVHGAIQEVCGST